MRAAHYRIAVLLCVWGRKARLDRCVGTCLFVCEKKRLGRCSCACVCVWENNELIVVLVCVCMCAKQTKNSEYRLFTLSYIRLHYFYHIASHDIALHHTIIYHIEIYYIIIFYLLWSKLHHWIIAKFALKPQVVVCCSPFECGGKRRLLSALDWFQRSSTQVFSQKKWFLQVRVRLVFLI